MTRYEKFESIKIRRGEIKNAPYNPRTISASAKNKLRGNIKTVGLLGPVTVNRRIAKNNWAEADLGYYLLSGHQRLASLDILEHTKDYSLTVSVVELDERTEKAQNVFLNNSEAQGSWDLDALKDLLKDIPDIELSGFDRQSVDALFGDIDDSFFEKEIKPVEQDIKKLTEIKASKKESGQTYQDRFDTEYYIVVVFKNRPHRERWLMQHGLDKNERYLSAEQLNALFMQHEKIA